MMTIEQISAVHKANLEVLFGLTEKALTCVEKLADLNLAASKAALHESATDVQALFKAKDLQSVLSTQSQALQPIGEKFSAYARQAYDITSGAYADISKDVEEQLTHVQKSVMNLVDAASKNAPAGSDSAVSLLKTTVAASNNAYETMRKAIQQAAQVAESNLQSVASHSAKAATTRKR